MPHLLVAGVTTRALAVSAAQAGWRVTAVDAFGDLDLRAVAAVAGRWPAAGRRFSPAAAARAACQVMADAVAYTSNFENHPAAVAVLARDRRLLGNPPDVLLQIRNPVTLMRALRRRGFAVPETRASVSSLAWSEGWLSKPRRSGGGHGTAAWRGNPVRRSAYLQRRIGGTPGSIAFLADGRRAVPIGLSRQLVGERAFGAHGFRYCGSLLAHGARLFTRGDRVAATAVSLAAAVTEEFGLVGLNGLDFIAHDGVPLPIEVNPRYSASMELIERAQESRVSLFRLHERACAGVLPRRSPTPRQVAGKAVVFARRPVTIGTSDLWAAKDIADIPHPGEQIDRGHPICTVFARGRDARECHERLVKRARQIHRMTASPSRGAA